jgi:hypothetical protein
VGRLAARSKAANLGIGGQASVLSWRERTTPAAAAGAPRPSHDAIDAAA